MSPRAVDPERASSELAALVAAGAADEVTDYDYGAGLERHLELVAALPVATAAPGAGKAAVLGKGLALVVALPVAAAVATALWLGGAEPRRVGADDAPVRVEVVAPPPAEARAAAPVSSASEQRAASDAPPSPHRVDAPTPRVDTPSRARPAPRERAEVASERVVLAESAPEAVPRAAAPLEAPPAVAAAPVASAAAVPPGGPVPTTDEATPSDGIAATESDQARAASLLQRDMESLMEAKRALASNPADARTLAERGQREFPRSLFAEERRHIYLLALVGMGRVEEARRLAGPYLKAHPGSPFARRVQQALDAASRR